MKKLINILLILLPTVVLLLHGASQEDTIPDTEKYFGQKLPELMPEKFAPGLVSTEENELNCVFTPDGQECFFSVWKEGVNTIMTIKQKNGQWTKRAVASFSGIYSDVDPFITADGKRLYFSSMRPLEGQGEPKDSDLWFVEKNEDGQWGNLSHLGTLNSEGKDDYYTSITQDGIIYFSIFGTHGSPGDIYKSKLVKGVFATPEYVGYSISTRSNEHDPFIAPDESYLIFTSDRPGGFGKGDLYISFRNPDGSWSESKNMGKTINSENYEYCPMLSPDGHYLFFTRNVNRNGDIFWVSSAIIDSYKPGN